MTGQGQGQGPGKTPRVWVVRAGKHGQDEEAALDEGMVLVGFQEFGDLQGYSSPEALSKAYLAAHPGEPQKRADSYARQLWALREKIAVGDTVVLPLKLRKGQIAVGTVTGPYAYGKVSGQDRHTRRVKWVRPDVPRTTFRQDLLHSFGAFSTVFQVRRNDAERRVQEVLKGTTDPGAPLQAPSAGSVEVDPLGEGDPGSLEEAASDEITAFMRSRFPDHDMARLVEAVLQADGFVTIRSAPGPDGGADILAGRGPLGLDQPYLCVQVKAVEEPVDVKIFRELAGTMAAFKASQGLLVSWGGFKQTVVREARQETFKIRLWDQNDLVAAVYRTYERLPAELQAELPLKRVWMLVREGVEEED